MSPDPYRPPATDASAPREEFGDCPACGASLERGSVTGTLRWLPEGPSAIERFVGGKRVVGPRSFSITLQQPKETARRCPACHLILVHPDR